MLELLAGSSKKKKKNLPRHKWLWHQHRKWVVYIYSLKWSFLDFCTSFSWNLNFHFTEKVKGITLMYKLQYDPFKYELNMNNLNVGILRVPIIFVNGHIVQLLILLPVMWITSIITSFHTFSLYFTYLCLFWSWAGPTSLFVWPFCLYRSLKNVKKIWEDCPGP